ncbi:MAG: alpha-ketoglutarate-dependent dioxygenase AlkB [Alphaproteobacteria bacterium]|nr:alpha-ketoglutarate-dependent dioxygenase AlkB [Alphaproteobacteria bacterium]
MGALFADLKETLPDGASLFRNRLTLVEQREILDAVERIMAEAPPFRPQMPTGPYMINSLTNCGPLGWISDRRGYRYEPTHPTTGKTWPPIPAAVLACARALTKEAGLGDYDPDACLVNIYEATGKLSLHRDFDEADFRWPIVSFSFGNDADFLLGGLTRGDRTTLLTLHSGDVFVLGGPSRARYHGVRRIRPGTSPLTHNALPLGGRINLTLRRAR